jgi:hypothetical protein
MVALVNLSGRGDKDVDSVLEWDAARAAEVQEASEVVLHPSPRKWRKADRRSDEEGGE